MMIINKSITKLSGLPSVGEKDQVGEVLVPPQSRSRSWGKVRWLTDREPGMVPHLLKGEPLQLLPPQTAGHQAPSPLGHRLRPAELLLQDVLVREEGNVPHQHVVQEDPEAPHCQTLRPEPERSDLRMASRERSILVRPSSMLHNEISDITRSARLLSPH